MAHWDWLSLKDWISGQSPVLIAAGDITGVRDQWELSKEQDLSGLDWAISLAYPLPPESIGGITDRPTLLYKHAYGQLNYLMDRTAMGAALRLQESGHRALPVPASQIISWGEPLLAHVNHRQVAVTVGQGWYGRNNLLVTPSRGAQARLVTVLTDMEVFDPGPWFENKDESGCGKCVRCRAVCPVGAIHEGPADFDLASCAERNRENEKLRGIGQRICGVCVKACKGPAGIRE